MSNTFQEINRLRKSGNLEEAYRLAESSLIANESDPWLVRAMGWVLYAYMDQDASRGDMDGFLKWLESMSSLHVDKEEQMLLESVAWSLRKLLVNVDGYGVQYDNMLSQLRSLPSFPSGKAYSSVLGAALKLDGKWNNLISFIDWWDLSHLSDEDYRELVLDSGKKMMSLAERAVICYSKNLLRNGSDERIDAFIPFLKNVVSVHEGYRYPPYYLAKLLLKKGDRKGAFELLKQFVKRMPNEFWVWQLLSDTQDDDELRMSFLCKSLLCRGKEEMLVSLREQAALLFAKLGYLPEAKFEALKAMETRRLKGWGMTNGLRTLQVEKWFMMEGATKNNELFYRQFMTRAEEIVMGETHRFVCLISYVNDKKRMASFVTEGKEQGFFRIPKGVSLERNVLVEISVNEVVKERPTMVRNVNVLEEKSNPAFFRYFEGYLKNKVGFGLVDDVFVEHGMMRGLSHGAKVSGKACISYDKKNSRWGWRALSIDVVS